MSKEGVKEMPVCSAKDMERLLGVILTMVEASMTEERQAEALKSLIKQTVWWWYDELEPISEFRREGTNTTKED